MDVNVFHVQKHALESTLTIYFIVALTLVWYVFCHVAIVKVI